MLFLVLERLNVKIFLPSSNSNKEVNMCHQHITMQKSYHVQAYKNHEIVNELDVHPAIISRE